MEIKTKFDLGQQVWIIIGESRDEIVTRAPHIIREICINNYLNSIQIEYKFSDIKNCVYEDCVFKTKKEAEIACAEREQRRLANKLEDVKAYLRALIGEYQL
jgi:hypothetical protein